MFAITISEKGGETKRLDFDKAEVTIGRVQGNDVVLPKGNVSKRHSRIVLKDGKYIVVDLKSTNGTYVNGRKITSPIVIKGSDKVYIGDFVITIDEAAAGEQSDLPPPLPPPSRRPPGGSIEPPPPPPRRSGPNQVTGGMDAVDASGQPAPELPPPLRAPELPPLRGEARPADDLGGLAEDLADSPPTVGLRSEAPPRTTRPLAAAPAPSNLGASGRAGGGLGVSRGPAPPEVTPAPPRPVQAQTIMRQPPAAIAPPRERVSSQPFVPAVHPAGGVAFAPPSDPLFPQGAIIPPAPPEAIPGPAASGRAHTLDRVVGVAALQSLVGRLVAELQSAGVQLGDQHADAEAWRRAHQVALELAGEPGVALGGQPAESLAQAAVAELLGAGPLDALLADAAVEAIRVVRHDRIVVDRAGERTISERYFSSPEAVTRAVARLLGGAPAGGSATARLASGHELVAVLPPVAVEPSLLVRRERPGGTLNALVGDGALSRPMAEALALAVRARRGIVVAGEAPAGRAAVVSALLQELESTDCVVTLGDGAGGSATRVAADAAGGGRGALGAALRLEPDRLVVGADAGAAAVDALLALPGTIVAVAASSGADAVGRLLAQARLAHPGAEVEALREALASQAQLVVALARDAEGRTRVARVSELERLDERGRPVLADLFVQSSDGAFGATGRVPAFAEGAAAALFKN